MGVKILSELFKVQYSILVGVSSLHNLKEKKARSMTNKCLRIQWIIIQEIENVLLITSIVLNTNAL